MVIVVEIEDRSVRKPFLGGWRDRRTEIEYHNASTQTLPRKGKIANDLLNSRDTQTVQDSTKSTSIPSEKSIQTYDNGVCIPSISDKILLAKKFDNNFVKKECLIEKFQDGVTLVKYLDSFALKIQKFYRAYKTRSMIRHYASVFRNLVKRNSSRFYRAFDEEYGNVRPLHIIRSTNPRTREDFEMLYSLVDRWKSGEIERANRCFMRCSRIAAHAVILKKEIELLRAIDRIKNGVKKEIADRKNLDFLAQRARPITWTGYKGFTVSMETIRIQKAKEQKKLYEDLAGGNNRERIEVLFEVRESLRNHRCESALETAYLIDQELCLIAKNLDDSMLKSLRERLKLAYLCLIKNDELCLESRCQDSLDDAPKEISKCQIISRLCIRCGQILSVDKFRFNRHKRFSVCLNCESRTPKKLCKTVNQPYEEILRKLRRREAKYRAFESVAFVIGPKGLRHLVEGIWHGKSGVSESTDVNQLAVVRFNKDLTWSPWNSLVLTEREAAVHANIDDMNFVYSKNLIEKFFRKNLQARLTFQSLDIFHDTKS